jgi:2-keto-4-pentenoate hydratase
LIEDGKRKAAAPPIDFEKMPAALKARLPGRIAEHSLINSRRKLGFTNTTIWSRYGVSAPLWAHLWAHTVRSAKNDEASLNLVPFVQPRIEPEVVFTLSAAAAPW